MAYFLGIDTSNYTTSAAIYDSESNCIVMEKKLLEVKGDACGLRQSDAVFLHVKQLDEIIAKLFADFDKPISAVGVSAFPRRAEGSYMPCFLVGNMLASCISSILKIPKFEFSHQEGHIVSALFSADILKSPPKEFFAFHVSGGTTEAMIVTMDEIIPKAQLVSKTLDLNAGQAVDRIGVMLGLSFPCGPQLELLAKNCEEKIKHKIKLKGLDCCISGLENKCKDLFSQGKTSEYIAKFCITYIGETLIAMTDALITGYGEKPIVYAGGVMSNSIIKQNIGDRFNAYFASPQYSADNSAGIAILASKQIEG